MAIKYIHTILENNQKTGKNRLRVFLFTMSYFILSRHVECRKTNDYQTQCVSFWLSQLYIGCIRTFRKAIFSSTNPSGLREIQQK